MSILYLSTHTVYGVYMPILSINYMSIFSTVSGVYTVCLCVNISLSTIVLNSRDWSEIVWLPEISCFKINLGIGFIRKNPLECIG